MGELLYRVVQLSDATYKVVIRYPEDGALEGASGFRTEAEALAWNVSQVEAAEIDQINILQASILAMHHAVDKLTLRPDFLLIDGNRFKPYLDIKHLCVIKGDAIYMSIAAASLLAKTHRDDLMQGMHKEFPYYGWDKNKGYPTILHRDGIRQQGACKYHRKSFTLLPTQFSLF